MRTFCLLKFALLSLLLLGLVVSAHARGGYFSKPFTYYAENQELHSALTQFARVQGYSVSVSPAVVGKLSGRFDAVDPLKFLQSMQAAFGINWYAIQNSLYFYNENELSRAFITPRTMSARNLYTMLDNASVFSPQLMPTVGSDDGMISISGPPLYINQVTQAATSFEMSQASNYVMEVFPLKHAWADNMTVRSLDQEVTVPGIATILRSMVLGLSSATNVVQLQSTQSKLEGLHGKGLSTAGKPNETSSPPTQNTPSPPLPNSSVNIIADPRVNAVIINDAAYRMPYYKKVIADLDKPVELVEIHVAIVDINTNYKRDLGVAVQGNFARGDMTYAGDAGGGFNFTPTPIPGSPVGGLNISTIYTNGADYFLARVQALEQDGNARVLGRPSVLTVDNVQASLENTTTYYLDITGYESADLFKVEAGTVLRVTPHIILDEERGDAIKLAVNIQDNQSDGTTTAPLVGALPPIKQTKINTQAIVGVGQSLLIGGYYYEQKGESESGVPILKNIPLFGYLFKTTDETTTRMERLILITPKVVRYDQPPALPTHIDEPSFVRSPTQDNYERRTPEPSGGCSKNPRPSDMDPPQQDQSGGMVGVN